MIWDAHDRLYAPNTSRHCFLSAAGIWYLGSDEASLRGIQHNGSLSLLQSCHQIHNEALPVLHQRRDISNWTFAAESITAVNMMLSILGPVYRRSLKRLQIPDDRPGDLCYLDASLLAECESLEELVMVSHIYKPSGGPLEKHHHRRSKQLLLDMVRDLQKQWRYHDPS